jgi:hypothetical protein
MRLATGGSALDGPPGFRVRSQAASNAPVELLRSVPELPASLGRLVLDVGEGSPYRYDLLREGLAYVAFVEADATGASDYATVVMALEERAPRFTVRPLPIVEGKLAPNAGLVFKGDPEFSRAFLVEGREADGKAIRAFLSEAVRDELLRQKDAWLFVDGDAMALTRFGAFDLEQTDRLVEIADVVFAEHGAGGGVSLLEPDDTVRPGSTKRASASKVEASEATA